MQTGGWARQQNGTDNLFPDVFRQLADQSTTEALMPIATQMAGVNMRLEAGAFREVST
jgi:hypothetical protein